MVRLVSVSLDVRRYSRQFVRGPPAKASESPESERWGKRYAELIEKSTDFISGFSFRNN
jgi:hypothetical protein